VSAITSKGGRAVAIQGDVAIVADIYRIFDEAEATLGKLDIVVHNAAIVINKPMIEYSLEDYTHTFDTNSRGAFFVLQQAAARVRDGGRIIAISSGGTRLLLAGTSLYLGSKGAVEQFVRSLSKELGSRNITVNSVSPGFTNTELLTDEFRGVAASMSPFNRIGEPEEVAAVVSFVASPAAGWVTGQNIGAGGGVM
jgi:3-oxoacyl-[acyl-carrier protein] reductase